MFVRVCSLSHTHTLSLPLSFDVCIYIICSDVMYVRVFATLTVDDAIDRQIPLSDPLGLRSWFGMNHLHHQKYFFLRRAKVILQPKCETALSVLTSQK